MSEISIYDIVPTPKLADKLIGTSVGGVIEDVTYNFTLQELLQLFIPNLPANNLQGVLDYGNTATQNINLTGTITTTNLSVLATANILNSNLSGNTRVMAGLFDRTNASGTAGQFLRSTGTQVEWFTIPTVIPTLQQVLQSGNTSNISIVLTANLTAVTATADTVISNTSLNVNGVLRDGIAAVGASNQILSSTGSGVRWVDMPVYNVVSPLLYDTPTKTFSIQVASSSQSGYLSSADWINFDGKQDAIILTTSGTSGAATFVANTLNIPVYSPDLSGYVPTSRTLTINGVSYDLSANRSWTIAAGVASVTATAPLSSSGGANPDISISQSDSSTDGYLSSVDWIDFNSKQDGLNGTGLVKSTAGVITYITDNSTNWNTAYNDSIVSAAVTGTATKTLTLNQQDGGTIQASWSDIDTGLTSVGVSMPSAFSVANSPLTSNGTIAITGAGTSLQYVDGTGALQTFPGLTGFVPYTGATTNVDLGVYSLTASALIKSGGTSSQFLKADGTVDSTSYQPFITAGTTSQYYRGDKTFQTLDTTVVPEGTNLYYLDSRARAALSFAAGSGAYNSTTGVITIPTNTNQLTNGASFITLSSLSAASPLSYNNLTGAFSISQAGASTDGYLSSTDWTTFNAKQVAGNYIVSLTGEATAVGPGAAAVTLNNASVTGKVLTGVNITGGTVLATDTMLTAFGKLQNQINGLIGSTIYQGVWDASTNTPTLTSSVGTNGFYYIVNVAGSTNLNGITDWKIGDWAIFNGGVWQKVDNTESVTSVNGFTGAVSLTTDNVAQGTTNLYFANSLARAAISLTVTGASGASTYNNTTGVLNVPTYTLSGLGGQPLATNLTSLSGLTFASTSFVKMTAAGTFALDTNTYALSSALANYLPLAGGTLTGALGGTTASFSGAVSTNAPSGGATGEGLVVGQSFKIDGSGTSQRAVMYVVSNVLSDTYGSGLQIQGANLADDKGFGFNLNTTGGFEIYVKNTSYNKALTIANTKAATFADTVTATSLIKTGGTSAQFLMADGSVSTGSFGDYLPLAGGTMTGQIVLKEGTTSTDYSKGLRFPNDPYGGSGDTSGLRLYANTAVGFEAQILELYVTNDGATVSQDKINFAAPTNDFVTVNGNKIWNEGNLPSPQSAITLTTTGTSGAATLVGATLNIPQYQSVLTNPITGSLTTNFIPKATGATTIGNSIISEVSSKISITSATLYGWIYSNDTNHSIILRADRDGTVLNYTNYYQFGGTLADGLGHKFWTGGNIGVQSLRLQIADNGVYVANNLLVGTTTDAGYKLDVNGTGRFSSSVTANTFVEIVGDLRFNSNAADRSIYFRGTAGAPDGNWKMGTYLTPTGATVVTAAATVIDVFNGAGYGFMVRNTSNSPLLQIAGNTGAATFSSSVTAKTSVAVSNNGAESPVISVTSAFADGYRATVQLNNTHTGGKAWLLFSTNNSDGVFGGGKFVIYNNNDNVSALTIASTGAATFSSSVGIGNTATSDRLSVTGTDFQNAAYFLGGATTGASYGLQIRSGTNSTDYALQISNRAGGELFRVRGDGNVGIGTTSPSTLLHVNSGTTATQTIANFAAANYSSASSRTYIQIGTQYGDGSSRIGSINTTGNQSALVFQTHAATSDVWNDAMYINGSGNVGIGTASPGTQLQIEASSSPTIRLNATSAAGGAGSIQFYNQGSQKFNLTTTATNNDFALYNNGGTNSFNLYIPWASGNVLIGTITDNGSKLQVNGTTSLLGTTALHDNLLRVRTMSDPNHAIVYNGTINGPLSYGYYGSGLGYTAGGSANITLMTYSDQVLIGYTTPQGYKLAVNGQVIASAYFESSDAKLKNVNKSYDSNNFGTYEFTWKDKRDEKNHWGYIAQEVETYLPDAVSIGGDGFLAVDYNQAHTYKIAKVEDEVTLLKKRVEELEQQLNLN